MIISWFAIIQGRPVCLPSWEPVFQQIRQDLASSVILISHARGHWRHPRAIIIANSCARLTESAITNSSLWVLSSHPLPRLEILKAQAGFTRGFGEQGPERQGWDLSYQEPGLQDRARFPREGKGIPRTASLSVPTHPFASNQVPKGKY